MVKGRLKRSIVALTLTISMLGSTLLSGGPLFVKAETGSETSLGGELVQNGGFGDTAVDAVSLNSGSEETVIGSTGWTAKGLSPMTLKYSVTEDGELQIVEATTSKGTAQIYQNVSVESGKEYTFSARVKAVGAFTNSNYVETNVSDLGGGDAKYWYANTTEWFNITHTFTATKTGPNKSMRVRFWGVDKGYWLIDDMSLIATDSPNTNLFKAGNLDELSVQSVSQTSKATAGNYANISIGNYKGGTSNSNNTTVPYCFAVVKEATTTNSNNLALKVSTAPASGQVSSTLKSSLEAGKTYVLSADVTSTGIQDLSADEAGLAKITFTAGGESVTKTAAEVITAGNKVSAEITVPAEATELNTISLKVENFTNGTWTIDNVSLKEKITAAPTEPTLSVSASASEVEQGKTVEVTAALADPSELTQGNIAWSSTPAEGITITPNATDVNKAAVSVADTVEAGTVVTITATKERKDGKEALTASCTFTVKQKTVSLTGISIVEDSLALEIGETKQLSVSFDPENATNQSVTWESETPAVATVDNSGKITAVAAGTAVIKVISAENSEVYDTVSVKVKVEPSLSISVTPGEVTQGGTVTATATLTDPDGLTEGQITWTSNVTVGITIIPNGDGSTATISVDNSVAKDTVVTVTATKVRTGEKADLTAEGTFTVKENIVPLTKVEIAQESVELEVGGNTKLETTLAPENATNKNLTWTSSDEAVATVDENGNVTAKGAGAAVITVASEAYPELKDSVSVTVIKKIIDNGTFDVVTGNKVEIPYVDNNGSSKQVIISYDESGFLWRPVRAAKDYAVDTTVYFEIAEGGRNGNAMKIWRDNPENVKNIRATLQQTKRTGFVEGEKYLLTAYVKSEDANKEAYIRVSWFGADGKDTNGAAKVMASECVGEWTAMTFEFTCGEITKQATIQLEIRDWQKGVWYIDDVSVIQLPADPYFNLDKELSVQITEETVDLDWEFVDRDNVLDEPTFVWESSDESVVTVDQNGKLTLKGLGTASVTVSTADGKCSAMCMVTVTPEVIELTGIALEDSALALQVGGQKQLEVVLTPENTTQKELSWSSDNEAVVKVDENGKVTALSAGTAVITVASKTNSALSAQCTVTVSVSDKLSAEAASFEISYGSRLDGSLAGKVTNTTGETAVYQLYEAPVHGSLKVNADGTFVYAPGISPSEPRETDSTKDGWADSGWEEGVYSAHGGTYTFKVLVTAGAESTILEGTIVEKDLSETLAALDLTDNHLLFSEESIAAVREAIKVEGSFKQKAWKVLEQYLASAVKTAIPQYEGHSNNDTGTWQRHVADRAMLLLVGYLVTGDEQFKDRSLETAAALASYPWWGEKENDGEGQLTAAHNSFALAMIYDWLKDDPDMTQEVKADILKWLYYASQRMLQERTERTWYMANTHMIALAALVTTATTLYYDAEDAAALIKVDVDDTFAGKDFSGTITVAQLKADCEKWIRWVCSDLGQTNDWMPADGAAYEGYNYYEYGTSWLLNAYLLMEEEFGIDAFTGNDFLKNSIGAISHLQLPENHLSNQECTFDYNDGYRYSYNEILHIMSVLATKYQSAEARHTAERALEKGLSTGSSMYWLTLFFGEDEAVAEQNTDSTLFYSEILGQIVTRSDWSGNESILFVKCGLPTGKGTEWILANSKCEYHCDPDCNSLILYANGEFLLKTDGRGYKDSMNHSTLIINGQTQIGSHSVSANNSDQSNNRSDDFAHLGFEPTMTLIESTDAYDYFVGDATEAYYPEAGLVKFQRNFIFLKEENVLLIVDDIKASQQSELQLRWFPESKSVTENYGIYSVYGENTTLNFYPFTEGVETVFETLNVRQKVKTEDAFAQNYTGTAWQNAVAFSWGPNGEEQIQVKYQTGNVNEHMYEVNGKVYTINVSDNALSVKSGTLGQVNAWASDSTLSAVLFNGAALEEFDGAKMEYTLERFWKTKELEITPVASAPTGATVNLNWDGKCPGTVTITCTSEDKTSTTTYTFVLKNDNGMLGIESATANPNTQDLDVGLTYDNFVAPDAGTKTWSSKNLPVVIYDMGRMVDIKKIDVAFNASSIRGSFYDLLISDDGENWTTVQEAAKSEKTAEDGPYNDYRTIYSGEALRARYVRINLRGNDYNGSKIDSVSAYGAIQEISIYGAEVEPEETTKESTEESTEVSTEESTEVSTKESTKESAWESTEESTEESAEASTERAAGGESEKEPETGDNSRLVLWFCLMALCLFGTMVSLKIKKKSL